MIVKKIGESDELVSSFEQKSSLEPSSSEPNSQDSTVSQFSLQGRCYQNKNLRGSINIMTEDVVAVLDACRISYRNSVLLIGIIANTLGHNIENLILNKSSFNRARLMVRQTKAENLKKTFDKNLEAAIIHWDGKIIPDAWTFRKVDRLPILVSESKLEKILDIPALPDGKGITQASAIYEALHDWGLKDKVKALCCDTTNANLGNTNGAAIILEQFLETSLLYLPCRHHIYELTLASVFQLKLPGTKGPDVPLFKRFRDQWLDLDPTKYDIDELKDLHLSLLQRKDEVIVFAQKYLKEQQPRDDYKELLELCLIFLGIFPEYFKIRKPGAYHHARWMSKAIYSIKIFLFRKNFKLGAAELKKLYDICLFVVFVYVEAWFLAPNAVQAPNNDLKFIKKLYEYAEVDPLVSNAALEKIKRHLWYLSPEASAISFFDDDLSFEVKHKMVLSLEKDIDTDDLPPKKYIINNDTDLKNLKNAELDHFINGQSLLFFYRFNINKNFLYTDCKTWYTNDDYLKGLEIVKNLRVVNDAAERAVKLAEDYMNRTKNEDQKLFLVQNVSQFRRDFEDASKQTIVKKLKK